MNKLFFKITLPLLFFLSFDVFASEARYAQQLIVVTAPQLSSSQGSLQRFERSRSNPQWKKVGKPIAVVLGKKGLSFNKEEGDLKTPLGIFPVGPLFGFSRYSSSPTFLPIRNDSRCVDDPASRYYNQIIHAQQKISDWRSAEVMRHIPLYQYGAVIQYNPQRIPGAGSCLFLHIWRGPDQGTAGCIAMEKEKLLRLLAWVEERKEPLIVIQLLSKAKRI